MKEITLTSGAKAVVDYFGGKEQRLLTQQNGKPFAVRLNEMMASFVQEIGGVQLSTLKSSTNPKDDQLGRFLDKVLAADKKQLLTAGWLHTYEHDPVYGYSYEYTTVDGATDTHEETINLSTGFPTYNTKKFDPELIKGIGLSELKKRQHEIREAAQDLSVDNYDSIPDEGVMIEFAVPVVDKVFKDNQRCRLMLLNGMSDKIMAAIDKDSLSSHSVLIARRLQYFVTGDTPVTVQSRELDLMHQANIEYIRLVLKIFEGRVDTEYRFKKPEDDKSRQTDEYKIIDLLSEPSFFFPSGTI